MTWPRYSSECRVAVDELLKAGGSLSAYKANPQMGPEPRIASWADRLERQLEIRMGVKHAVAVNSGTAALHAALAATLLPGRGFHGGRPEVITSPFTFSATASAILLAGGTPVFADVDPQTFCITKETVKRVFTRRTKAIVPVSLFGGLADVRSLQDYGVPIVEDACQAVGATQTGNPGRVLGRAFSFNGTKNIPSGECGAVLTDNPKLALKARLLMNHGENFGAGVGYNYRPNELTCAVAFHGLMDLRENNRQRIMNAAALTSMIRKERKLDRYIEIPDSVKFDGSHVFYVYPFKIKNIKRSVFARRMDERHGITVGQGYITPTLNHYPAFKKYATRKLPIVESLSKETLCLFYHIVPNQPMREIERTVEAMVDCVSVRR